MTFPLRTTIFVVAFAGVGCEPEPKTGDSGPVTVECTGRTASFMPYDGERIATYVSRDPSVSWRLVTTKESVEDRGGTEVATFAWTRSDTGERLGAVAWSADDQDGIHVHGWQRGEGEPTWFTVPVALGCPNVGSNVTTETDGITFQGTFVAVAPCPVPWGMDWEECLHFTIDDGDGDDDAGPIFAGDWWLVSRYGPAWFQTTGHADVWELEHYEWHGE